MAQQGLDYNKFLKQVKESEFHERGTPAPKKKATSPIKAREMVQSQITGQWYPKPRNQAEKDALAKADMRNEGTRKQPPAHLLMSRKPDQEEEVTREIANKARGTISNSVADGLRKAASGLGRQGGEILNAVADPARLIRPRTSVEEGQDKMAGKAVTSMLPGIHGVADQFDKRLSAEEQVAGTAVDFLFSTLGMPGGGPIGKGVTAVARPVYNAGKSIVKGGARPVSDMLMSRAARNIGNADERRIADELMTASDSHGRAIKMLEAENPISAADYNALLNKKKGLDAAGKAAFEAEHGTNAQLKKRHLAHIELQKLAPFQYPSTAKTPKPKVEMVQGHGGKPYGEPDAPVSEKLKSTMWEEFEAKRAQDAPATAKMAETGAQGPKKTAPRRDKKTGHETITVLGSDGKIYTPGNSNYVPPNPTTKVKDAAHQSVNAQGRILPDEAVAMAQKIVDDPAMDAESKAFAQTVLDRKAKQAPPVKVGDFPIDAAGLEANRVKLEAKGQIEPTHAPVTPKPKTDLPATPQDVQLGTNAPFVVESGGVHYQVDDPEIAAQIKALQKSHADHVKRKKADWERDPRSYPEPGKASKASGMETSAEIRKLLGAHTPKEAREIMRQAERASMGSEVITPYGPGKVVSPPSFGKIRVELEDGRVMNLERVEIERPTPEVPGLKPGVTEINPNPKQSGSPGTQQKRGEPMAERARTGGGVAKGPKGAFHRRGYADINYEDILKKFKGDGPPGSPESPKFDPKSIGKALLDVGKFSQLGSDFGSLKRQGLFLLRESVFNPEVRGRVIDALKTTDMAETLKSVKSHYDSNTLINGMNAEKVRELGGLSRGWGREEGLDNIITKAKPLRQVLGRLSNAQEIMLDSARNEAYDAFVNHWLKKGKMPSEKELTQYAKFLNSTSGRSNMKLDSGVIDAMMTSPRYEASRWETAGRLVASPVTLGKAISGNKAAKAELRRMGETVGVVTASLGAMRAAGWEVNWTDPMSPDWLRARRGDQVIDFAAGIQPRLRSMWRVAFGIAGLKEDGKIGEFARKMTGGAKFEYDKEIGKAVTRSFNIGIVTPLEMYIGKDFSGYTDEEYEKGWIKAFPLIVQGFNSTFHKEGLGAAVGGATMEFFGDSTMHYPKAQPKLPPEVQKILDKYAPSKKDKSGLPPEVQEILKKHGIDQP